MHRLAQPTLPRLAVLCAGLLALAGCKPQPPATSAPDAGDATAKPALAVRTLTAHLRDNDLAAFARDAVPPRLHAQLEAAWRSGRTRWPLDELPFGKRLPAILAWLSAPEAQTRLQRVFDQQFAHAAGQIRNAATTLGMFGTQYLQHQGEYSDNEREHYAQLVAAVSAWGARAPLGDPKRARTAIATLTAAARNAKLGSADAFAKAGMDEGLRRVGAFAAAGKRVLRGYGWDLDADLAGMDAALQQQTGDTATVRMRYTLAGTAIDTLVAMRRIDGRWYVDDFLRHAEAAAAAPPAKRAAKP